MPFKPGQSGNPSGRPAMPKEVREAVRRNGELAVRRMAALLEDDSAWGPKGWLKPKEQILLATVAQERAYGKAESVSVSHEHGGTVLVAASISDRLQGVADKLPERRLQSAVQHERKRLQAEVVAIDQPSKTPSG